MADTTAPEYLRFIAAERRAKRLPPAPTRLAEGQSGHPITIDAGQAAELLRVAARRAVKLFRPSRRSEFVWTEGENELAISLTDLHLKIGAGLLLVMIPVRCDQTGPALIEVAFAVGAPDDPTGLFASTFRRPNGPPLIVDVWGDALVAFAWQCLLGMVSGLAGASGKDQRGNVLVPVELHASSQSLTIVPLARHRFGGSSGLTTRKRGQP